MERGHPCPPACATRSSAASGLRSAAVRASRSGGQDVRAPFTDKNRRANTIVLMARELDSGESSVAGLVYSGSVRFAGILPAS
ncbi:MAG: hypothetical protein QOH71_2244 [Blastocatellia bacterium]|jgi:hypothetical protein|nr:hypothetical protein [Blastocatellia bacterium]